MFGLFLRLGWVGMGGGWFLRLVSVVEICLINVGMIGVLGGLLVFRDVC